MENHVNEAEQNLQRSGVEADLVFDSSQATLMQGDSLSGMKKFASNTFDLAIADPPYGASTTANWHLPDNHGLNGFGGAWKLAAHQWDMLAGLEGFRFTLSWLSELARLVKPEGSIWIHSTYHNSGMVNIACQILGLEIINEVIWYKRNAFPNLAARRLTASHETILWIHTGGPQNRLYRFNYDEVKAANFAEDRMKEPGKQLRTVWDIPNNKTPDELKFGKHPTQKPLRLIARMLLISGLREGKFITPFAGAGSEMKAAIQYGMHATGFEISPQYSDIARQRLVAATSKPGSVQFELM
ncbi:MAG TPA: site-specific DNA-methyltransferase [Pyrinomonadaceae bacterium]|jgi:site-specific DNA-methyltransferase (adenine-specific)|nr:site-specific DNA-methyltransferase [Pyrinomonadaceae bacterium]